MAERPPLTPGKVRGLAGTSTPRGVFTILAIDHRDSLRVVLDPGAPGSIPASALTQLKLELLTGLADGATAVMLDPEYSAAQAIVARALPGSVGFLVAVEAQGYLGDPGARQTSLLDGWSVAKAKRLGADGIKLLVLYRPDGGAVTDAQDRTIVDVIADCARHDIPLFLEPLLYARDEGPADDRRALVVETVRRLGSLNPDVLKVQFPLDVTREPDRAAWRDACAELDDAAPVPWALLSGGGSYGLFRDQVEVACDAGRFGLHGGPGAVGRVRGQPGARLARTSCVRRSGRGSPNLPPSLVTTVVIGASATCCRTSTSSGSRRTDDEARATRGVDVQPAGRGPDVGPSIPAASNSRSMSRMLAMASSGRDRRGPTVEDGPRECRGLQAVLVRRRDLDGSLRRVMWMRVSAAGDGDGGAVMGRTVEGVRDREPAGACRGAAPDGRARAPCPR